MMKFVKRDIFEKIAGHLSNKEITMIIGPRQVGKTVLVRQLMEYLEQEKKIDNSFVFYFNLDIYADRELFLNQSEFITFIKQRSHKNKIYIFVDEAQKVKNAGVFFKGVYDSELNVKIILTGSSTLEIRSKIFESLTGRKRIFHLLPFSFSEILKAKNPVLCELAKQEKKLTAYDHKILTDIYKEYCMWGAYPQVVLAKVISEKKAYLEEIFRSYIEKDIVGFLKIKNENNFIKLIKVLAAQIGGLIDVSELSKAVNTDRYTIDRYLETLEKTFIIKRVKPFHTNSKKEIVKAPTLYFLDNGIRNYALHLLDNSFDKMERKGLIFENSIFKELLLYKYDSQDDLKFWRSKQGAEVDFVICRGAMLVPIEVKVNLKKDNVTQSLLAFIKKYKPEKVLVINLFYTGERDVMGSKIKFVYPYFLPLIDYYCYGDILSPRLTPPTIAPLGTLP